MATSLSTDVVIEDIRAALNDLDIANDDGLALGEPAAGVARWAPAHPEPSSGFETLVKMGEPLQREVTIQVVPVDDYTIIALDEDDRSAAGARRRIPEPSALTRRIASLALSAPRDEAETKGPLGPLPVVGLLGQHAAFERVASIVARRNHGMARLASMTLDALASFDLADVAAHEGSVLWFDPVTKKHLVFPSMIVATQLDSIARRIQTESVASLAMRELAPAVQDAIASLRGRADTDPDWPALATAYAESAERERLLRLTAEGDLVEATLIADDALRELDAALRRVGYLEREFQDRGLYADAPPEAEELPEDVNYCVEVLQYARELLDGVRLSPGVDEHAAILDEDGRASLFAKKAWLAIRSLNDYTLAKARDGFEGDFLRFCTDPPSGCLVIPAAQVALHESKPTLDNAAMYAARLFRVPSEVSDTREILMEAHIKVANGRGTSPRMHFFDDTSGGTGKVHIGYLGPHLPVSSE